MPPATSETIDLLAGVVLALGLIAMARARGYEIRTYGVGLAVAAAIYVAFALVAGAGAGAIGIELVGLALFGVVAALGARRWLWLLAAGWAVHAAWDVLLHTGGRGAWAPGWYPTLCVGFDLFLAGYVLALASQRVR